MAVEDQTSWCIADAEKTGIVEKIANYSIEIERVEIKWNPNKIVEEVDETKHNGGKPKEAWGCWHEEVSIPEKHKANG